MGADWRVDQHREVRLKRRIFNVVLLSVYFGYAVWVLLAEPVMMGVIAFAVLVAWVLQWLEYRKRGW